MDLAGWVAVAQAHDPGLSSAILTVGKGRLDARLTFAPADLAALLPTNAGFDTRLSPADFARARQQMESLAQRSLEVTAGGTPVAATDVRVERLPLSDNDNILIRLSFPLNFALNLPGPEAGALRVRSTLLGDLPAGHRQYVAVADAAGQRIAEHLLDARTDFFETTLATSAESGLETSTFGEFLVLGVEHIVTGYDHLLFLFALLVVGGSFASAAKVITSFSVAHSITLALATLDWVYLPAGVVEPLIAVSIVYVGMENLFRRNLDRRWLVTFAFGLVHGLGFASVLRDAGGGLQGIGIVAPLLSFNLGVEAGQIAIAAVALPLMWRLERLPSFPVRYAPVCSVVVIAAGAYWFIERALLG